MTIKQAKEKAAMHRPDLPEKEQSEIAKQLWIEWLMKTNIPGAVLSVAAIVISLITLLK